MNTMIYFGLDGLDTIYQKVFHCDQTLAEVCRLQQADPEWFHRQVMAGSDEDYLDYLNHQVHIYHPDNMTESFVIWQRELDIELAHQQAISLNKAYDLLIDAGACICFPTNDEADGAGIHGLPTSLTTRDGEALRNKDLEELEALAFARIMRYNPDECCCQYDQCYTLKECLEKGLSTDNICPGADNKLICHMLIGRCSTDPCPSGRDDI